MPQDAKVAKKLTAIVKQSEHWYRTHWLDDDVRNLAYYRGKFWEGDGYGYAGDSEGYLAESNEIFPLVDTITSALAMDVPQVIATDRRVRSFSTPNRADDETIQGRRVAAVLNWWAETDDLDETVREFVLHAILFRRGTMKVSWSPENKRPIWRTRLPWETFFDPTARRQRDIGWAFERFPLRFDDFQARVDDDVYEVGERQIKADVYPRSLVDEHGLRFDDAQRKQADQVKDWVGLIEFWDFRKQKLYHLHEGTGTILLEADMPYPRPYEILVFHDGVGRVDGVSDVSLVSSNQRDINESMSARRESVTHLGRRVLVEEDLFDSELRWSEFKNSRTIEPTRVRPLPGKSIAESIMVTPEVSTTFDFNRDLEDQKEAIRYGIGLAEYQRSSAVNIRTAAEANMIRGATEGRLNIRSRKLTKAVRASFHRCLDVARWAIRNHEHSHIDIAEITANTQADVAPQVVVRDLMKAHVTFKLAPFSPLMEDHHTKREQLVQILSQVPPDVLAGFDTYELLRELVEFFGFRPSMVKSKARIEQETAAAMAAEAPVAEAVPAGNPATMPLPGVG